MRVIEGKIEGNQSITEDIELRGMIVGNTIVTGNCIFELRGMIVGNLTAGPNSTIALRGTVNGNVINKGGYIKIFGMINGSVSTIDGTTEIDPNAVISN